LLESHVFPLTNEVPRTAAPLHRPQKNARDLYVPTVSCDVLEGPPEALEFYRSYVAMNRPCVIRGAFDHWPALERWSSPDYLRSLAGSMEVSVEVTPNGRADALIDAVPSAQVRDCGSLEGTVFALPHTQRLKFGQYLDTVNDGALQEGPGAVSYVSHQDSSLTDPSEFAGTLLPDIEAELAFASTAFGCKPDAINFWCVCLAAPVVQQNPGIVNTANTHLLMCMLLSFCIRRQGRSSCRYLMAWLACRV